MPAEPLIYNMIQIQVIIHPESSLSQLLPIRLQLRPARERRKPVKRLLPLDLDRHTHALSIARFRRDRVVVQPVKDHAVVFDRQDICRVALQHRHGSGAGEKHVLGDVVRSIGATDNEAGFGAESAGVAVGGGVEGCAAVERRVGKEGLRGVLAARAAGEDQVSRLEVYGIIAAVDVAILNILVVRASLASE